VSGELNALVPIVEKKTLLHLPGIEPRLRSSEFYCLRQFLELIWSGRKSAPEKISPYPIAGLAKSTSTFLFLYLDPLFPCYYISPRYEKQKKKKA
jgi:hypothetical protein